MNTVLIVCTANQCRSPVAEALLKKYVMTLPHPHGAGGQQELLGRSSTPRETGDTSWLIRSAGTWAQAARPAHTKTRIAAREVGIDLRHHRACAIDDIRPLTFFRLILAMAQGHKEALCVEFPEIADRVYLLSEIAGEQGDVSDPVGHSLNQHRLMIHEVDRLLQQGLPRLVKLAGGGMLSHTRPTADATKSSVW